MSKKSTRILITIMISICLLISNFSTVCASSDSVQRDNSTGRHSGNKSVADNSSTSNCVSDEAEISAKSVEGLRIKLSRTSYTYNGLPCKPHVKVILNGKPLTHDDFDVSYQNNINVGTATVTVNCNGNYVGKVRSNFTIKKAQNPLRASLSRSTFKYKAVKKSKRTTRVNVSDSVGKVSYSSSNRRIKVSQNGKITVSKGTPRGKYTISVKASGGSNYSSRKINLRINVV